MGCYTPNLSIGIWLLTGTLLFVSYKAGHKGDIHKNTVSFWVRKVLFFAYAKALEDVIRLSIARTHEVRALVSSMAFLGLIELEEVL